MTSSPYYVVESLTLGSLKEFDTDGGEYKARYSLNGSRDDSENTWHFATLDKAKLAVDIIRNHKLRGHKSGLRIHRSSDWRYLCEQCGGWVSWPNGHDNDCPVWREYVRTH